MGYLAGCSSQLSPPDKVMVFASAALKAAEKREASKRAPDYYHKAMNFYWEARRSYQAKEFESAKVAALKARRLFERAEIEAEVKKAAD